jgi:hypothetical protein
VDITNDHVLSGCKTFHKHCNIVTRILAHDGFEWDEHNHRLLSRPVLRFKGVPAKSFMEAPSPPHL